MRGAAYPSHRRGPILPTSRGSHGSGSICRCGPLVTLGIVVCMVVGAVLNFSFVQSFSQSSAIEKARAEVVVRDMLIARLQGELASAKAKASLVDPLQRAVQLSLPPPPPPSMAGLPAVRENANEPQRGREGTASTNIEPAPVTTAAARALLIICFNRPAYLKRTLDAVRTRLPTYNRPHIYVSQDGDEAAVTAVITEWKSAMALSAPDVPVTHWRHPGDDVTLEGAAGWATGYYKLSQHFRWALNRLFGAPLQHPRVIILEDDLEIAVDFFDYFTAVEPLLDAGESNELLGASAWSDLGQAAFVDDPSAVLRSDFFPGLGWMLTSHVRMLACGALTRASDRPLRVLSIAQGRIRMPAPHL